MQPRRAVAGEHRVLRDLVVLPAEAEVVDEGGQVLVDLIRVDFLDDPPDGGVQIQSPPGQQALVGDVLDDGVLERQLEDSGNHWVSWTSSCCFIVARWEPTSTDGSEIAASRPGPK